VQTFVLVTGDGDFIHLINNLRTRGKRVVIIGTSWNTSWQLTNSADTFIAYDIDVDPASPRPSVKQPPPQLDEAFKVLADIVKYVREKRRPNVFAQVKLLLASRLGSFDEQAYGFSKFKDFMKEAERRGFVKTHTVGLTDRVYLPDEEIESGLTPEAPAEVEMSEDRPQPMLDGRRGGDGRPRPLQQEPATAKGGLVEDDNLVALVRFVDILEQSSPFMSFNYIVNRTADARVTSLSLTELSALVDRAIQDGMFMTDTRTILDRVTGEYRDINIFRLNQRHPLVARIIAENVPADMLPLGVG
jgi:hypothetical protein